MATQSNSIDEFLAEVTKSLQTSIPQMIPLIIATKSKSPTRNMLIAVLMPAFVKLTSQWIGKAREKVLLTDRELKAKMVIPSLKMEYGGWNATLDKKIWHLFASIGESHIISEVPKDLTPVKPDKIHRYVRYDTIEGTFHLIVDANKLCNYIQYSMPEKLMAKVSSSIENKLKGKRFKLHVLNGVYTLYGSSMDDLKRLLEVITIESFYSLKSSSESHKKRVVNFTTVKCLSDDKRSTNNQELPPTRSLDQMFFSENSQIYVRIKTWKDEKQIYEENFIPYKIAMMLYGPPGTGKSQTALAIAKYLDYDLIKVDFRLARNFTFLHDLAQHKKTVLWFDEFDRQIDAVKAVQKRLMDTAKKMVTTDKITLDKTDAPSEAVESYEFDKEMMLEFMSALENPYSSELVMIFTTNSEPKDFPKELIRPGRIDYLENVGLTTHSQFEKMFKSTTKQKLSDVDDTFRLKENYFSPAYLIHTVLIPYRKEPQEILKHLNTVVESADNAV